jgi:CO/xanthine dehydrogenase FAD-binding subunit
VWRLPALGRADVACPSTLAELLACAAEGRRPYAGGTDLLLQATNAGGDLTPLVWTPAVAELAAIESAAGWARIGAAATITDLLREPWLTAGAAALRDAASVLGSVQIRNRATLAGNLCNASPAADTVPALVVHDAIVQLRSPRGSRRLPVTAFATGPGQTVLEAAEVVTSVDVSLDGAGWGGCYRRFTVRKSMDLAFAGVAARIRLDPDGERIAEARLALGAVAPVVVVAEAAARLLGGRSPDAPALAAAAEAAAGACSPISDLRGSAGFRRQLIRALVHDVVTEAYGRARERAL